MNNDCAGRHGCCVRLFQQLLDPSLGLVVLPLAEVLVAHLAGCIDKVMGRPVFIVECVPDGVVAVERDGVRDGKLLHGLLHVGQLLLEVELRRVDADDHQAAVLVLFRPGADVGNRAQAVDTGVGPEVDEDDLSFELLRGQRRRVDPGGRAGEAVERGAANNAGGVLRFEQRDAATQEYSDRGYSGQSYLSPAGCRWHLVYPPSVGSVRFGLARTAIRLVEQPSGRCRAGS